MTVETTLSTLTDAVASIWALLVILIWATYDKKYGNKKLVSVFLLLNLSALISITTALYGLKTNITADSNLYLLSFWSAISFIVLVAIYYSLLTLSMLLKPE